MEVSGDDLLSVHAVRLLLKLQRWQRTKFSPPGSHSLVKRQTQPIMMKGCDSKEFKMLYWYEFNFIIVIS